MNVNKSKVQGIIDVLRRQQEQIKAVLDYEHEHGAEEYGSEAMACELRDAREHCLRSADLLTGAVIGDLTAALTCWPDLPPVYAHDVVKAVKRVLGPNNEILEP